MSPTTLPLQRYLAARKLVEAAPECDSFTLDMHRVSYLSDSAVWLDRVFFIREGEVSVVLSLANGSHQRLATLSAGMSFGELVMLGNPARSASVHADTAVSALTLSARALDELAVGHPEIKIAILRNLSVDLAHKLRQAISSSAYWRHSATLAGTWQPAVADGEFVLTRV